jgi:hypothetical protein
MNQTIHQLSTNFSSGCSLLDIFASNEDFFNIDESQHINSTGPESASPLVRQISDPILQTMLGELGHSLTQASKLENERLFRMSFLLKFSKRYKKRQLAEANSNWQASLDDLETFSSQQEESQSIDSVSLSDGSQQGSKQDAHLRADPIHSSNKRKSVSFSSIVTVIPCPIC